LTPYDPEDLAALSACYDALRDGPRPRVELLAALRAEGFSKHLAELLFVILREREALVTWTDRTREAGTWDLSEHGRAVVEDLRRERRESLAARCRELAGRT